MTDLQHDSTCLLLRSPNQLSADLGDGETVLMSVELGQYFSMNEVGARVWALLEQPVTLSRLCQQIEEEFDVDADTCKQDVIGYVTQMCDAGLATVMEVDQTESA